MFGREGISASVPARPTTGHERSPSRPSQGKLPLHASVALRTETEKLTADSRLVTFGESGRLVKSLVPDGPAQTTVAGQWPPPVGAMAAGADDVC